MPFDPENFRIVKDHDCEAEAKFLIASVDHMLFSARDGAPVVTEYACDPLCLLEVARLNKLLTLLPDRVSLLPKGCDDLPETVMRVRLMTSVMNQQVLSVAAELGQVFQEHQIRHVHIKGPLQQLCLYNSVTMKPSADVDLLVQFSDQAKAAKLIQSLGFQLIDKEISLWWKLFLRELHYKKPDHPIIVDLHHGLHQAGLPVIRESHSFFSESQEIRSNDLVYRVPGPEHRVILSALSIAKAFIAREPALSNIVDFLMGISHLSISQRKNLRRRASAMRVERIVNLALRIMVATFPKSRSLMPDQPSEELLHLETDDFRKMAVTPWLPELPWPRRSEIINALSGAEGMAYLTEMLKNLSSEGLRRSLEWRRDQRKKV